MSAINDSKCQQSSEMSQGTFNRCLIGSQADDEVSHILQSTASRKQTSQGMLNLFYACISTQKVLQLTVELYKVVSWCTGDLYFNKLLFTVHARL